MNINEIELPQDKAELVKRAYDILLARDPEFKRQYDELRMHSPENINNSPVLKMKVFLFMQKYDSILADEIKMM